MKNMNLLFLTLVLAMLSTTAKAGDVTMKTGKTPGESLCIAVNEGVNLTITWSDGTTEQLLSNGQLQEITVKTELLTISSSADITSLYLADNELTELDISGIASTLRRLFCPNNKLTRLNLAGCSELRSLDCQGNNLSALSVVSTVAEDINFADNQISTNGIGSGVSVTSLVCANNALRAISNLGNMTSLQNVFFQNNNLSTANLSKATDLRSVLGYGNAIATFDTKAMTQLRHLWMGNNKLSAIDLSANTVIESLCIENNQVSELLTNAASASTFRQIDLSNNKLFFPSFPSVYSIADERFTIDGAVGPQTPYFLLDDQTQNKRSASFRSVLNQNAWGAYTSVKVALTDEDGTELVAGTDYRYSSFSFTFLTAPHKGVTIAFTSAAYPGTVLTSEPFDVLEDPTGIISVSANGDNVSEGAVFDLQGRRVGGQPTAKGIYIVNGKKIVVR